MYSIYEIIKRPVISEKSSSEIANNHYWFEVAVDANKIEIGRAVEKIYNVKVKKVNVINCKGKSVSLGRRKGVKPDWKKALVILAEGQKIEALSK